MSRQQEGWTKLRWSVRIKVGVVVRVIIVGHSSRQILSELSEGKDRRSCVGALCPVVNPLQSCPPQRRSGSGKNHSHNKTIDEKGEGEATLLNSLQS